MVFVQFIIISTTNKMAQQPVCVADFQLYFKRSLASFWYEYFNDGADDGHTYQDNVKAFQRYRLRPRYLRDVSHRFTRTSILGRNIEFPVGVSPTACHAVVHKDGERATAKAVASVGTVMILSVWGNTSLEDVAASVPEETILFMQLNFFKDKNLTREVLRRVIRSGRYKALVVTIDQPYLGNRLSLCRAPFSMPPHLTMPNVINPGDSRDDLVNMVDPASTWDDVIWLRGVTSLPIILKGILTAECAKMAVSLGVDGILVSNHGGRQLDGVAATIDSLSEVVEAVKGTKTEVYLDGGVRRGTDVLKALAMGARAVFIGRPALWGLAYNGEAGVRKVLEILKDEFKLAMALSGCSSVAEMTPDLVMPSLYSNL